MGRKTCEAVYPGDIVRITDFSSIEESIQAMKHGAAGYVLKPIDLEKFKSLVAEILAHRQQRPRLKEKTAADGNTSGELIGASPAMQEVRRLVAMVALAGKGPDAPTVLITGETGTGKGVIARARGNASQAARLLGISRNTLRYRLEKHGLQPASSAVDDTAT